VIGRTDTSTPLSARPGIKSQAKRNLPTGKLQRRPKLTAKATDQPTETGPNRTRKRKNDHSLPGNAVSLLFKLGLVCCHGGELGSSLELYPWKISFCLALYSRPCAKRSAGVGPPDPKENRFAYMLIALGFCISSKAQPNVFDISKSIRPAGMSTTLQELATLDRVIHEPARLMIMTVLYAVSEADFIYCKTNAGSRRESFQPPGATGRRGLRSGGKDVQGEIPAH